MAVRVGIRGGKRAAKAGDEAYNARRRYTRAAQRYMKKADESTGAVAGRYRQLAKDNLASAMGTYDKSTTQKISKPIQSLADRLGVDTAQARRNLKARTDSSAEKLRSSLISEERSKKALAGTYEKAEERRQAEARAVIFSDDIGRRILGGTVEVWRDKATGENGKVDKKKILPALYEHFKVDNLADLLIQVENLVGDMLYSDVDSETMYETVKLTIANAVSDDNDLVE